MFQGEATNGTTNEIRKAILEQNHLKKQLWIIKKWDVYACIIKGYPYLTTKGINTL
jgi:hypothetical protein